jgi:YfiH family protein
LSRITRADIGLKNFGADRKGYVTIMNMNSWVEVSMMEPFILDKGNNELSLLWLRSWVDHIPGLSAGFTTRVGGASVIPYQSLNCALHVGDDPAVVASNRSQISQAAGFNFKQWTCAEQVHRDHVHIVTVQDRGAGRLTREEAIADTDAMITDVSGVMLTAFYADCVPLYFVDPVKRVVGLAHAGWKGTALHIADKTLDRMGEAFGSRRSDIIGAIGPAIGSCCYEVDEHVVSQLDITPPERKENGRFMLDLKEVNRQFMIRAGMKPKNIEHSKYCTCCDADLFFSHRGEGGHTGRMAAWIGWKDEVTS